MASYMPSMKWPAILSQPVLKATDEQLDSLPAHEQQALSALRSNCTGPLQEVCANLAPCDVWRGLNEKQNARLRDEILLRFLRYNALSTAKAQRQMEGALQWREESKVASEDSGVRFGEDVGIPICELYGPTEGGDMLFFCPAEYYLKRLVDHAKQAVGVGRMFDFLLYDENGPRAKRGSIVIDFTNMSVRNVDLIGLKTGIGIYTSYFPDVFLKIIFINYPKFIYGVWKAVSPLLDARTVSRVVWVTSADELKEHLSPAFGDDVIPKWMGGQGETEEHITLYTGAKVKCSDLVGRIC